MTKIIRVGLVCLFFHAIAIQAQTGTGLVSGSVSDPQHAVLINARVRALEINTQSARVTSTNDTGFYSFSQLKPGDYEVSVEIPGFARFASRVRVSVGTLTTVDAVLSLAQVETNTNVVGDGGVQVETQTPMLSEVVNSQQITQSPTLRRNPYDLVSLAGNISPGDPGGRGVGVAINGQRAASTDILLDGAENTDVFVAGVGVAVPLDSVNEFRLTQSSFTAEYGRATGGMVDVETRSGTNNFHGSLYEFNRISALASNNFDNNARGIPRGIFTRNQFGYAMGGPVLKNRLFFFQSTEWTRVRSQQTLVTLVPTPEFIAASAPETQAFFTSFGGSKNPINGPIFTKADVLAAGIDPGPGPFDTLPLDTPVFGQAAFTAAVGAGGGSPQNAYSLMGRLDFNASENTKIFGRVGLQKQVVQPGVVGASPYPGYDQSFSILNKSALIAVTHVFSPALVSLTKVGFNRLSQGIPLGAAPAGPALSFPGSLSLSGITTTLPGYAQFPIGTTQYQWQFYQDVSWTQGKHLLRAGGQFLHFRNVRAGFAGSLGAETVALDPPDALNNFLAGQLSVFNVAVDPQGKFPCSTTPDGTPIQTPACLLTFPLQSPNQSRATLNRDAALYAQDTWRVRKRLTLSLGLRWEYYGVQQSADSTPESNYYLGTGPNLAQQIRNGQVLTVDNSPIHSLWRPDYNNLGPRIGFAWDLFGDGSTSLRGGYGISYERNFGEVMQNLTFNPPTYALAEADAGTPQFPTLSISTANLGPFAGNSGTNIFPPALARRVDDDITTAYAETWSVSAERQLLPNTVLDLSYSGSHGVQLYSDYLSNLPGSGVVYGGDDPAINLFSTLSRQYQNITTRGNGGFSIYHALQVRVQGQNIRHSGLSFNANYTWAHAIDNSSSTLPEYANELPFRLGFLDPFNPALDRGDSVFDLRQRFVASAIWQSSWFHTSGRKWKRLVLGGWSVAPVISASTGNPFSVSDCTQAFSICPRYIPSGPVSLTGHAVPTGEPNFFRYISLPAPVPYANPEIGISDFPDCSLVSAPPCPFPSNMTRRDAFRGPGQWNLDLGIYKGFRLREGWDLQFRGEFFNALNHPNLQANVDQTDASGLDFVAASKFGSRDVQLALKLTF